jgi:outer membrane protein OmpA-like peptidoglycan-associated protein
MRLFLLLLITFLGSSAFAQNILMQDTFDKDKGDFYIGTAKDYSSSVQDGKFYVECKTGGGYSPQFARYTAIDYTKDFTIEMEVSQLSNKDGNGYGIRFGCEADKGNFYSFIMNETGYYSIYKSENKKITDIKSWTREEAIVNKNGVANTLKIENKNKHYHFYINNHKVCDVPWFKFFGNYLGVEVNNRMKIAVDRLTVFQERKIHLSPDLPKGLEKKRMSTNVNSPYPDYYPKISPDGRYLFMIKTDHPENTGTDKSVSDIWYSELEVKKKDWGKAKNIGRPINTPDKNYVISITPDNNTLLIGNKYNKDGTMELGLSMSHRTGNGWSFPESVTVKNFNNLSDEMDASLSADRKILVFSMKLSDSYGENDLYVCFLNKDNTWTEPKHIGGTVNTFADDIGPFLAADGKTLYYSTAGKPGYGDNDIFVTKRLDDSWQHWSEPLNLGPEINTTNWDSYYTVAASGEYAIVTSSTADAKEDLFLIKLPKALRPDPVNIVQGRVLDSKTKKPVLATINYETLIDGKGKGFSTSNAATGEYKIVLPYGHQYGFHAQASGYIAVNENIDLPSTGDYKVLNHDLYLVPIEIGESVKLNNVFFVQSKAELLHIAYPELDRLAEVLANNPTIEIELSGYTDNIGDPQKNLELSEQRVETVKEYLVSKGINAKRITGKGYGGSKAVADNGNEETRKLNRRVEFKITKK